MPTRTVPIAEIVFLPGRSDFLLRTGTEAYLVPEDAKLLIDGEPAADGGVVLDWFCEPATIRCTAELTFMSNNYLGCTAVHFTRGE